jgi:hypothetical protein
VRSRILGERGEATDWALDIAKQLAKDIEEDIESIERTRGYLHAWLEGRRVDIDIPITRTP